MMINNEVENILAQYEQLLAKFKQTKAEDRANERRIKTSDEMKPFYDKIKQAEVKEEEIRSALRLAEQETRKANDLCIAEYMRLHDLDRDAQHTSNAVRELCVAINSIQEK